MFTILPCLHVIFLCLKRFPANLNLVLLPSKPLVVGLGVLSVFETVTITSSDNPLDFHPVIQLPVLIGVRYLKIG